MYNDNNSDFDKKTIKMELSFYIAIKLELFHNILLVPNANKLKRFRKAFHKVESSSIKCNLFVVQRIESSFTEHNASVLTKLFVIDNDIKLCSKIIIRSNRYLFNSMNAISKYVKMFGFSENHLMV